MFTLGPVRKKGWAERLTGVDFGRWALSVVAPVSARPSERQQEAEPTKASISNGKGTAKDGKVDQEKENTLRSRKTTADPHEAKEAATHEVKTATPRQGKTTRRRRKRKGRSKVT
jgi:hypothetical protein